MCALDDFGNRTHALDEEIGAVTLLDVDWFAVCGGDWKNVLEHTFVVIHVCCGAAIDNHS